MLRVTLHTLRVYKHIRIMHQWKSTPGGGTWVFFGWVCAARDSKLAPRSRKIFP